MHTTCSIEDKNKPYFDLSKGGDISPWAGARKQHVCVPNCVLRHRGLLGLTRGKVKWLCERIKTWEFWNHKGLNYCGTSIFWSMFLCNPVPGFLIGNQGVHNTITKSEAESYFSWRRHMSSSSRPDFCEYCAWTGRGRTRHWEILQRKSQA